MIIAIDLGTTHSRVAAWVDGAPRLIPNASGDTATPSCVGFAEDGRLLVGTAAHERMLADPSSAATAFKRGMGGEQRMRIGERDFRPEELSALVLRSLRADAEAHLGHAITDAVLTVPACFTPAQRDATRLAAELAGMNAVRLIEESAAVALMHALRTFGETRSLIFRLGAGSFDVAVVGVADDVVQVLGSAGDGMLGGVDFVDVIVGHALASGVSDARRDDPNLLSRLRQDAERALHDISAGGAATLIVRDGEKTVPVTLDDDTFATLAQPLINRLWYPIERAMRLARVRAADLDAIVLAGGATRMPAIRALVTQMFGRGATVTIDPEQIAVLGAAVQAGVDLDDRALRGLSVVEGGAAPPAASTPRPDDVDVSGRAADPTLILALGFAGDVGSQPAEAIPSLLTQAIAELRTRYIDAPGQFEEHLVDLLIRQRISRRTDVFAAAEAQFRWHDADHLPPLGSRGEWIRTVLAQRDAWLAYDARRRDDWTALFAQAEASIDAAVARRWPEVALLDASLPQWLRLHVTDAAMEAWKSAFTSPPSSPLRSASGSHSPSPSGPPSGSPWPSPCRSAPGRDGVRLMSEGWRETPSRPGALLRKARTALPWLLCFAAAGIACWTMAPIRHAIDLHATSGDTPAQCAALYARLDRPDAYAGKAAEEIDLLKARAHRCARSGHWVPPSAPR